MDERINELFELVSKHPHIVAHWDSVSCLLLSTPPISPTWQVTPFERYRLHHFEGRCCLFLGPQLHSQDELSPRGDRLWGVKQETLLVHSEVPTPGLLGME